MNPADVPTIETTLRSYDLDGLLSHEQFSDLLDELRNRENIMIVDALDTTERNRPITVGDTIKVNTYHCEFASKGTNGIVIRIEPDKAYPYYVSLANGQVINFSLYEIAKVV